MAQPLLPGSTSDDPQPAGDDTQLPQGMHDLKIFWGPEICRLEYLLHLLDTGRVKDDSFARSA